MRRGMAGLQSAMHGEPHRLHASQQVFQDMGASAINPQLHEAVLADSLYRSVTERLQSGAGPASFNQVSIYSFLASLSLLACLAGASLPDVAHKLPSTLTSCSGGEEQHRLALESVTYIVYLIPLQKLIEYCGSLSFQSVWWALEGSCQRTCPIPALCTVSEIEMLCTGRRPAVRGA